MPPKAKRREPNSRRSAHRADNRTEIKLGSGWSERLFQPVDIAAIVFFRIAFGLILFVEVCRFFLNGWITEVYFAPVFHFTYLGFEWVRPWPGIGMYLHFAALGVLAVMIAVGWRYRLAMTLFCIGFTYVFLIEKAQYLNHFYLLCLLSFLMIFVPANRAYSWDARRDPRLRSDVAPAWSMWILRAQIAVPYFFGSVAKLNYDWLHGQPMQMWMAEMKHVRDIVPAFGEMWLALVFSYGGLLFDLLIVPLLLWRRTRAVAFCVAVVFHLCNAVMFHIGIFPWFMIVATTLFFEPDWPRRLLRRLRISKTPPATSQLEQRNVDVPIAPRQRAAAWAIAVFFAVQILVPFRHVLYPGDPHWTGEGQRFAWHMMLNCKYAAIRMVATDPRTGRSEAIDLANLLTLRQLQVMSHFPEMMREFAGFVREQYALAGVPNAEVRAFALCSLNGRKPQLLVDPAVDLADQPRTIFHQPYIVPLHEPLRERAWDVPIQEWEKHLASQNSAAVDG